MKPESFEKSPRDNEDNKAKGIESLSRRAFLGAVAGLALSGAEVAAQTSAEIHGPDIENERRLILSLTLKHPERGTLLFEARHRPTDLKDYVTPRMALYINGIEQEVTRAAQVGSAISIEFKTQDGRLERIVTPSIKDAGEGKKPKYVSNGVEYPLERSK